MGERFGDDDLTITIANLPASFGGSSAPVNNAETTLTTNFVINVYGVYPSPDSGSPRLDSIGMVHQFAGNFEPNGAMFCDGRLLPISEYEALFSIIGTTYGGDGQTTFALPDLRGRVPIGTGAGPGLWTVYLGETSGTEAIFLNNNSMPTGAGGGGFPFTNMQPTLGLTTLVAMQGIFPGIDDSGFEAGGSFDGETPYLGQIVYFAGNYAPGGWAMAQGQLLAIAQNQALFSLLGTQFGGNGQTTFALPDTRGRALIGADATHPVGSTQGTGTSSLTLDDIPGRTQYGDGADNTIYGGNHEDRFFGEAGHDTLIGNGGNDVLRGAAGDDVLNGGDGNDDLFGGSGIDTLIGGAGDDVYRVTNAGATVIELAGGGTDTVSSQVHGYVLPDNVENLIALGGLMASGNALDNTIWGTDVADTPLHGLDGNDTMYGLGGGDELFGDAGIDILDGGEGDDWLHGGLGSDKLYGGNGADTLDGDNGADVLWGGNDQDALRGGIGNDRLDGGAGADTLEGGAGNDTLIGGRAGDTMTGGTDADRFLFVEGDFASRAWRDIITDFSQTQGDVIHLAGVDAIAGGPDNAFTFLGTGNFTGTAGELRYFHSSGSTNVVGDTDGDGLADFTIVLMGVVNLTAADFVL